MGELAQEKQPEASKLIAKKYGFKLLTSGIFCIDFIAYKLLEN